MVGMMARGAALLITGLLVGAAHAAAAYVEAPVVDGGVVSGRVTLAGDPVIGEPTRVRKNMEACGPTTPFEALLVGPDKGVQDTVVYLEGIERGKRATELVIDNAKCVFVPHVAAVMVGAKVRIRNSDGVLHNTHGVVDRQTVFNVALPIRDQVVDITSRIKRPGVVEILCDAHTHMRGWLVVRDNPYFAVTDARGRYRIGDVPPGRYRLTAWHEGWVQVGRDKDGRPTYDAPRLLTREVTVPARGEVTVDLELK